MTYHRINERPWAEGNSNFDAIRAVTDLAETSRYRSFETDAGRCVACLVASAPGIDDVLVAGAIESVLDVAAALPDVPVHKVVCAIIYLSRSDAVVVPNEMRDALEPFLGAWRARRLS